MDERERAPIIPPSFEVVQEQARNDAHQAERGGSGEFGLRHLMGRVRQSLADAAKSLMGSESKANLRDYLPHSDPDYRIVMGYIAQVDKKFADNPEQPRDGWDEIWLPLAVEGQGGNVSRAQADRLLATLAFRSSRQQAALGEGVE